MPFELNSRTILVAMMIAMGLGFEGLKIWSKTDSSPAKAVEAIEDRLFGSKPYAISERSLHKTIKAPAFKLPKTTAPVIFDMKAAVEKARGEQAKVAEGIKKNEDAAKDWHWVFNRKTNQWVWKKKSDKKDAKEEQVATLPSNSNFQPPVPSSGASTDPSAGGAPSIGATPNTPAVSGLTGGSGSKFTSQAEWEAQLLKAANSTELNLFIQQYKNHLVTETVFYAVVYEMLKSSNTAIQQEGVTALSQTPSAESFTTLAGISNSQNSTLSTAVTTALNTYSTTNLQYLKSVLQQSSSNPTVLTAALNQLQTAVDSSAGGGGSSNPTGQGGANAQLFQGFIPVLQTLASNTAVANQVNSILSRLKSTSTIASQI